ncbi:HNH endonuclease [Sphaerisporangium sp. TRM90804]|uniref:HNH endonuclease n=1 Tax=Sphaerisporangium sp. TRM90804 TaxID=3031113 RepID=UPI002447C1A9|nr:HNH endonuclease [Sphaerisporangium sp. TRM90804]MDH2429341.1 HNH endonuclease [Sphaerisporangium sp. TRM90804]
MTSLLITDLDVVTVLASSKAGPVPVLLDRVDFERLKGRPISLGSHGYSQLWDGGRSELLHRWVMGARRGDGLYVDHVNRDRYDCRRSNLRWATPQMNAANRRSTAVSGYRGVYKRRKRWAAQAKVDGRSYWLGLFKTPEEAAQVAHEWRLLNLPGYLGSDTSTAPTVKFVAA